MGQSQEISEFHPVVKVSDLTRGWPEGSLLLLLHWVVGEGITAFSEMLHFTLYPYLIVLSAKQEGIN